MYMLKAPPTEEVSAVTAPPPTEDDVDDADDADEPANEVGGSKVSVSFSAFEACMVNVVITKNVTRKHKKSASFSRGVVIACVVVVVPLIVTRTLVY